MDLGVDRPHLHGFHSCGYNQMVVGQSGLEFSWRLPHSQGSGDTRDISWLMLIAGWDHCWACQLEHMPMPLHWPDLLLAQQMDFKGEQFKRELGRCCVSFYNPASEVTACHFQPRFLHWIQVTKASSYLREGNLDSISWWEEFQIICRDILKAHTMEVLSLENSLRSF